MSKPTKRPTKRKIETGTAKVMPTGTPRAPVKRVLREPGAATPATSSPAVHDDADGDDDGNLTGTRARKAAQAEKAATAKPKGRRSRRVTEKGTGAASSSRYTAPTPHYADMPSPLWVPVLMFTLLGLGMLTIIFNYVALVPGGTSNWYLLLGLGFILGGIITATQLR